VGDVERRLENIEKTMADVREDVAKIKTTVNLLVAGKIKQNGNKTPDWTGKVATGAVEIARLAIAALVGFFVGRGGS